MSMRLLYWLAELFLSWVSRQRLSAESKPKTQSASVAIEPLLKVGAELKTDRVGLHIQLTESNNSNLTEN